MTSIPAGSPSTVSRINPIPLSLFTGREREVVNYAIREGRVESRELGGLLGCSPRTIDVHWRSITLKLGVPGRTRALHHLLTAGTIE